MGLSELITVIFVIAILGFACWLLFRFVPMPSPFKEIILVMIAFAVILSLLSWLGIWHGPGALR